MDRDPAGVKGDPAELSAMTHVACTVRNIRRGFFIDPDDFRRWVRNAGFFPMENSFFGECVDECIGKPIRDGHDRAEVWANPHGCRINLSRLEREIGESRQKWSLAKRSLIESRVLIEDADGVLWINMHFEEWIYPGTGKPRLTRLKLAYGETAQPDNVAAMQAQFKFARERVNPAAPHRTSVAPRPTTVVASVVDLEAPRRDPDTLRVETRTPPHVQPDTPRVETASVAALSPGHLPVGPIKERTRGVLDPAETERGRIKAQPPAPDANFVSGKVEPWTVPESGRDYRLMAQVRPEAPRRKNARRDDRDLDGLGYRLMAKFGHLLGEPGGQP